MLPVLLVWFVALASATASPAGGSLVPSPPVPSAAPPSAPSADPLAYDDPAVHFRPPDGWVRAKLGAPEAASSGQQQPPAAVYFFHPGQSDQRTIIIDIQPFKNAFSIHATYLQLFFFQSVLDA